MPQAFLQYPERGSLPLVELPVARLRLQVKRAVAAGAVAAVVAVLQPRLKALSLRQRVC